MKKWKLDKKARSFPRLYAAASLKLQGGVGGFRESMSFSAALCRGLIEALSPCRLETSFGLGFPRLYAAASLKLRVLSTKNCKLSVFRGFMPRPH